MQIRSWLPSPIPPRAARCSQRGRPAPPRSRASQGSPGRRKPRLIDSTSSCKEKARPLSSTSRPGREPMKLAPAIVSLAALVAAAPAVVAADPVKIGLVAEFSGPFAAYGKQIENGMKAYLKAHGDTVAGRKIEILERDTTGPAPEVAKRVAQDLVTNDKIDFLAGFGLSPNAFAVAAVATQAKTPMVIMNAASSMITTKSPYVVRFSMTLPQVTEPIALWAAKNGIKKVYSIVSDYAPGIDAEGAFEKAF